MLTLMFFIVTKIKINPKFMLNSKQLINTDLNMLTLIITTLTSNLNEQWNQNLFWFFLYKQQFLTSMLKTNVFNKSINLKHIIPKNILNYISHAVTTVSWKRFHIIHGNEILEIIFLSLWSKNLNLIGQWIKKYFEKHHLKKHKKLFSLLNFLFGKLIWEYNLYFRIKGLRIAVRGKFGKAGSVRKSRRYIKRGKCSYSSKNLALTHLTKFIRTLTGTFSIKMELFFKKWCLHSV